MTQTSAYKPNPKLDLVLEREVDISPEEIWAAWTTPDLIKQWFTPAPWKTVECEIDLRPGGLFRTVMRSPEGQDFPNTGCFLEIVKNKKLVWTDALVSGYHPAPKANLLGFHFTAMILLEPSGKGTKYTAVGLHGDPDSRAKHDAMGFQDGWGKALDQLVAMTKRSSKASH